MNFLILILTQISFAASVVPPHWIPWPKNGTVYLVKDLCPAPCYQVNPNGVMLDYDTVELVNGKLVESVQKKKEKEILVAAEKARLENLRLTKERIKSFDPNSIQSLDDAKAIIGDIIKIMK